MKPCSYCNNEFHKLGNSSHERYCQVNPNRLTKGFGGSQKGTAPWNKLIKTGPNPKLAMPDEKVFCENAKLARHHVKRRIIERGLIPYTCNICGLGPEWHGKPMPLILDHINGINNDNQLHNLQFVCSNCESQLSTYKSRNIKKKD